MCPSINASVRQTFTFLFFFFFLLLPAVSSSVNITAETACNVTADPSFCQSTLPVASKYKYDTTFHGYGQYLVKKSLHQSSRFNTLIRKAIKADVSLPPRQLGALRDCFLLSQLTTEFLVASLATLNSTDTAADLMESQSDQVHTLLSAIVTNQETCLDGLAEASFLRKDNALVAPLVNGTKLYSISLAVFAHARPPKKHRLQKANKVKTRRGLRDDDGNDDGDVGYWVKNPDLLGTTSSRRMAQEAIGEGVAVSEVVHVAQDGSGNFTSIMDAVVAAPNISDPKTAVYFVITIAEGVYDECVRISNTKKIMIVGEGINKTIITGNRSVVGGWTTFNSATFAVSAQGFLAVGVTFRNTAGPVNMQAVAVRNGADLSVFYRCSFEGYQDTLYTHTMRQFYRDCDIYGTIDFIFGNSAVVFENCNLYARAPLPGQANLITAQGRTDPNQNTGISVINCTISPTAELAASRAQFQTYLGRPWKKYSRTVFINSFISDVVDPVGWLPWQDDFGLSTLYYGEFGNTGPGANTSNRVQWIGYHQHMNFSDVINFTTSNFVQGDDWLNHKVVPVSAGLDF